MAIARSVLKSASAAQPVSESAGQKKAAAKPVQQVTAAEMGARQREISVSEFFTKNRHLLGFDNPRKALLTCVKEAAGGRLLESRKACTCPLVRSSPC